MKVQVAWQHSFGLRKATCFSLMSGKTKTDVETYINPYRNTQVSIGCGSV
jgi:hypothetical protein